MLRRICLAIVIFLLSVTACGGATPGPVPAKLSVFAAPPLTNALGEIGAAFDRAHPAATVSSNFAGSQQLRAQLEQGAEADVFVSASQSELDQVTGEYLAVTSKSMVSALNRLVLAPARENSAAIAFLRNLVRPGVRLVLAAEEVPAGKCARQVIKDLDKASSSKGSSGYAHFVRAIVVSRDESVCEALSRVQLGEADAAFVYSSGAVSAPGLPFFEIPAESNVTASCPVVALADAPESNLAAAFAAYLLAPEAHGIIGK
jgi:molybdate transport system substrate-binding protein